MIFNNHENLEGLHAFLGASKFRWVRWDDKTLADRYFGQYAQQIGTLVHELASSLIKNRIKLTETDYKLIDIKLLENKIPAAAYDSKDILKTLLPFVNDAIGYRMSSEVILYYSYYCFGTADAVSYNEKDKILRISDLKTGVTETHMEQLLIYAALFCLEYNIKPEFIKTELRIYQKIVLNEMTQEFTNIQEYKPEYTEIETFMGYIKNSSDKLQKYVERSTR